ncbi:endonuclease/exonuclease/phosphatase family protein, putative, partial [hydrothermal vent metagenome]
AKLGYNFIGQSVNWDKKYVPFPYFPISLQFGKILSGQSVLSKYNIVQHKRIELPRNQSNPFYYNAFYLDRLAQIVKIKIQNKILVLINVHLEAYHQDTRIIQTKKVMALYQQYNKTNPTILLGDFNSDINYKNSSIQLLMNLPKTKSAAFDNKNIQNTFNSLDPNERLDYIFYNTEFIEYIDGHILSEFDQASDHLPILMNFKFK